MGGGFLQRLFELIGFESEWAGLALVDDSPCGIDQIEPVRPSGVRGLCRISEFIEHGGNFNPELAHTGSRDGLTLLLIARTRKYNLVFDVALHLPHVARVRLGDVHHQKADAVAVVVIELVESGNLPPEGRSSVAAEDQRDWFPLCGEGRKPYLPRFVEVCQCEIGSGVAGA
jgi:hypothetical protein